MYNAICTACAGARKAFQCARDTIKSIISNVVRPCAVCGALLIVEAAEIPSRPPRPDLGASPEVSVFAPEPEQFVHRSGEGEHGVVRPEFVRPPGFAYVTSGGSQAAGLSPVYPATWSATYPLSSGWLSS
jgi:hypothetical protein